MGLQSETDHRQPDSAGNKLVSNAERLMWRAHCRAAALVDIEPGPVSQLIFAAVHLKWREVFLDDGVSR